MLIVDTFGLNVVALSLPMRLPTLLALVQGRLYLHGLWRHEQQCHGTTSLKVYVAPPTSHTLLEAYPDPTP